MHFRILSVDGGGVKGLITAEVIRIIEKHRPGFIKKIDCFTGSSSGSIVSALFAAGFSPENASELFLKNMNQIFSVSWKRRLKTLNGTLAPIYEKSKLYDACYDIM